MSEKRFGYGETDLFEWVEVDGEMISTKECCELLNEQQFIIEELKTHNLQHFLEWLVIKRYVTDESLKDINNVIVCVDEFKEYLNNYMREFEVYKD